MFVSGCCQMLDSNSAKFRTSSAGETIVGRYYVGGEDRLLVSAQRPTTLICATGYEEYNRISFILPSNMDQTHTLIEPRSYPRRWQTLSRGWFFSSASLDNVYWIQIFFTEDGLHCRGLLFEYVGGGQRALGQCRLGVDRSETFTCVSHIAFANVIRLETGSTEQLKATRVSFEEVPEGDAGWSRFAMTGTLWFWFSPQETHLEMSTDE